MDGEVKIYLKFWEYTMKNQKVVLHEILEENE